VRPCLRCIVAVPHHLWLYLTNCCAVVVESATPWLNPLARVWGGTLSWLGADTVAPTSPEAVAPKAA